MREYNFGTGVTLDAAFTNAAGALVDPTTVTLQVGPYPAGPAVTYRYGTDDALARDGTGLYHCDVLPDTPGVWAYRWDGAGSLLVADQAGFLVRPPFWT